MKQYLQITVKDTGIGISPDMQEKIFDRFSSTMSGPTRNFEGAGIGLALCRELAKLHGGKITVQSDFGKGSSFTLLLPLKRPARPTQEKFKKPQDLFNEKEREWFTKIQRDAMTTGTDLMLERDLFGARSFAQKNKDSQKKIILIVEDNPDLLSFLGAQLQSDYRLLLSRDGEEALSILEKDQPDLVISDIMMPKMNGYEFCEKMKASSHHDIPLIFLTAKADLDMRLEGYQYGADDYLVKPFNVQELKAKVKSLLILSQMHKALQTKNRELERTLQELHETRDEKLSYVTHMAASLAHEIRNPLQPIQTYLDILQENHNEPGFLSKMIQSIIPHLNRMESLVDQLMHLSKIEKPILSPLQPIQLIEETLHLFEPKLRMRKILLSKDFSPSSHLIQADKSQLSQVFFNLIKNALEAMPQGGELLIKTKVLTKEENKIYQISFRDSGTGMNEEVLKNLFTPFFTTKKDKGTGLGLSISKQIIQAHQGTLSVESQAGHGATFIIELPVEKS